MVLGAVSLRQAARRQAPSWLILAIHGLVGASLAPANSLRYPGEMKLALPCILALSVGAFLGCGGAAHPRQGQRSRQACEQLLDHSFELERIASTLLLDDHKYQRRTIEADLDRRHQEILQGPTFMKSCNDLTDREFACMTGAEDWYSYQACYDTAPTPVAGAVRADAPRRAPDPEPPVVVEPPCPALESPGQGTATVTGTVRYADASAAPVVGAVVKVGPQDSDSAQVTITDEDGRYTLSELPAGRHDVTILGGSVIARQRCVALRGGTVTVIDFAAQDEVPAGEIIELGGAAKSPPTPPAPRK